MYYVLYNWGHVRVSLIGLRGVMFEKTRITKLALVSEVMFTWNFGYIEVVEWADITIYIYRSLWSKQGRRILLV